MDGTIIMNERENIEYLEALSRCKDLNREDSAKIAEWRKSVLDNRALSHAQVDCCIDLLDSATIFVDMLFPLLNIIGLVIKYRGVSLLRYDLELSCGPISALDLYEILICQSIEERKTVINRLTPDDTLRGKLNLAVESKKPEKFLSVISKARVNQDILKSLNLLNLGIHFVKKASIDVEDVDFSIGTVVKYVFSLYEQMLLDLAQVFPDERDIILINNLTKILELSDFDSKDFEKNISEISKIHTQILPFSFRKICRYILYLYIVGFYISFDYHRFSSAESDALNTILKSHQFRNYGTVVRRKCRMILSAIESVNSDYPKLKALRRKNPELWRELCSCTGHIAMSGGKASKEQLKTETFGFTLKDPDEEKLEICINAFARWGYIKDDMATKQLMYYRLTGNSRPETVGRIEWRKDNRALFLLIKNLYDKRVGKFKPMYEFFNFLKIVDSQKGNESAYADRTVDKRVKDLLNTLYGNKQ